MEKKKIAIIEDDAVLQKALVDFLQSDGFETIAASDGETGVRLVSDGKPDLVLLDIVLPKKDGYQVLTELKKDDGTKHIPVVLLTNLSSLNDVEKAINLGATTYLVKADYRMEEVVAKIKEILK